MRASNGRREIVSRHRIELEAGRRLAAIDAGVRQPADAGDNRYRAIAERAELRQAARLEPGWHDQRVRSRLNEMGKLLVIADHDADTAGIGLRCFLKTTL